MGLFKSFSHKQQNLISYKLYRVCLSWTKFEKLAQILAGIIEHFYQRVPGAMSAIVTQTPMNARQCHSKQASYLTISVVIYLFLKCQELSLDKRDAEKFGYLLFKSRLQRSVQRSGYMQASPDADLNLRMLNNCSSHWTMSAIAAFTLHLPPVENRESFLQIKYNAGTCIQALAHAVKRLSLCALDVKRCSVTVNNPSIAAQRCYKRSQCKGNFGVS